MNCTRGNDICRRASGASPGGEQRDSLTSGCPLPVSPGTLVQDSPGLPQWLSGKKPTRKARDVSSIPGSGLSPGEGNGSTLQYSCLENTMDRGAWRAAVHGVAKSQTRLSD